MMRLNTPEGERFTVAGPGDTFLLVFWSVWSTPCVPLLEELPVLADSVGIVTVLVDSRDPVRDAVAAGELTVAVPADNSLVAQLDIRVLPTVVIQSRRNGEVARFEGYDPDLVTAIACRLSGESPGEE
jgi:thioredoxin-like negative regulator of GroEL